MPYSIEWYVEGRVILEKAFGDITVEELVNFNREVTTLIRDQGVAPVHVIADLSKVGHFPGLREVIGTMRQNEPDKVGWMLVVVQNPMLRFVASMVFQVARLRLRMYRTMDEAVSFLGENDDSLAMR